jgi:hypothetical protein
VHRTTASRVFHGLPLKDVIAGWILVAMIGAAAASFFGPMKLAEPMRFDLPGEVIGIRRPLERTTKSMNAFTRGRAIS